MYFNYYRPALGALLRTVVALLGPAIALFPFNIVFAQQPVIEFVVEQQAARHPTLATDPANRILVGYEKTPNDGGTLENDVLIRRFESGGVPIGLPHRLTTPFDRHTHISAAINRDFLPLVYMTWIGVIEPAAPPDKIEKVQIALFEFDANIAPLPAIPTDPRWGDDVCSAGIGAVTELEVVPTSVTWTSEGRYFGNRPTMRI